MRLALIGKDPVSEGSRLKMRGHTGSRYTHIPLSKIHSPSFNMEPQNDSFGFFVGNLLTTRPAIFSSLPCDQ